MLWKTSWPKKGPLNWLFRDSIAPSLDLIEKACTKGKYLASLV